jgi:hypothetical protein
VIHRERGFFGGVRLDAIYYDNKRKTVQFTDWGRN